MGIFKKLFKRKKQETLNRKNNESVNITKEGSTSISEEKGFHIIKMTSPNPSEMLKMITGGWVPFFEEGTINGDCVCVFTLKSKAEHYINKFKEILPKDNPTKYEVELSDRSTILKLVKYLPLSMILVDPVRVKSNKFEGGAYYTPDDFRFIGLTDL